VIISRTPFRASLFGGGSDYPKWYRQFGGSVLGFAINKYCYISLRSLPPFFEHKHRVVYSRVETVNELSEIEHPAVRHILIEKGINSGIEIHHDGDLPARSGIGSSSSFSVGLLHALAASNGNMVSKQELAIEAIHFEQEIMKEHVGSQDQVWAAYGGMNRIDFYRDDKFDVAPLMLRKERQEKLMGSLMLFFSGVSRFAPEIAKDKIANLSQRENHMVRMVEMVKEAEEILSNPERDVDEIGSLLHESWMLKRELAKNVTTEKMDSIYSAAMDAGALGGKVLGAGGGGFLLFYVKPEIQMTVRERLKDLVYVDFDIDYSGSKIVVFEPNGLQKL
jgi:D-glycero-alpha-D-manno-heptose-7-phosphate kinase